MKVGIAISTYANENTAPERINIIKQCLDSLIGIDIDVLIVNDSSTNIDHINLINSYTNFAIIHKPENGGIAKCKNTAINYFKDYDYVFLLDDDVEILNTEFYKYYINASEKTGIEHFCYQHKINHTNITIEIINGEKIKKSNKTNGCMIMITQNIIKTIGYFKVLPYKYGHEHTNYTMRCINHGFADGYVDIFGSENLIGLIHESGQFSSLSYPSANQLKENEIVALSNVGLEKYIECVL